MQQLRDSCFSSIFALFLGVLNFSFEYLKWVPQYICMCYAPENGKEVFDLRVLGFAHINIFITVNGEETFDLRVLGRGRAG